MIRLLSRMAVIAALAIFSASSWAVFTGEPDHLLTDEQAARLPEAAQGYYQKAVTAFDHIDRDSGIEYLDLAAQAAPDNVPLQFALATRARDRGVFYKGVKALEYFDLAETAVQRILRLPFLSLEDKQSAERLLRDVGTEREQLPMKERKMAEIGFKAIVLPLAIERAKTKGLEVTPEQINAVLGDKLPDQPGTMMPGVAAGQFPVPGSGVPLASYGVPTERPPEPQQGVGARGQMRGMYDPAMMEFGGYPPGMMPGMNMK